MTRVSGSSGLDESHLSTLMASALSMSPGRLSEIFAVGSLNLVEALPGIASTDICPEFGHTILSLPQKEGGREGGGGGGGRGGEGFLNICG